MTVETFFANFGHLADAPNGVRKLRELILQLAVQGKLVPQDPEDEPASVLLDKIHARKQQLLKEKKLRKTKIPMVHDGDDQVELPPSWVYTTLYDIGAIAPRNEADDETEASFVPMPLIFEFYGVPIQSEIRIWREIKSGFTPFAEGDVCLAKITPCYQNGKSAVMRGLRNGIGAGTTELHVFRAIEDTVFPEYVLIFLKSPMFISEGVPRMTGSAGQKRITRDYFAGKPFPLPPLAEQHRIVAKVDQLMALCDELETRQQKQQQGRTRLNNAALDALLTAHEPDEFADHWQRISTNFDLLYDHPETIAKLRAAILQLAVQGKLVPQDPNDEPASVLLNKLRADRDTWLKKVAASDSECRTALNKLKKLAKPSAPFSIPKSWQFAKLIDCCRLLVDCHNKTAPYTGAGIPIIRTTNVRDRSFKMENLRYVSEETYQFWSRRCPPEPADIIFTREAPMGEAAIIPEGAKYCLGQRTMLIRPMHKYILNSYLLIALAEPDLLERTAHNAIGSTVKHFRVGDVEAFDISIPPFEEQKRIVAKVDQFMTLCDDLEAKLNQAHHHSEKLMEAAVRQILVA